MFKKALVSIFVTVCFSVPAFAIHPVVDSSTGWLYTVETIWHWECKPAGVNPIPIKMKIVMWADVYWDNDQDPQQIVIEQVDGSTFMGCVNLKVCVNFPGLKIKAKYTELTNVADKYYLSLVPITDGDVFGSDNGETELFVPGVHLTGNNLRVRLCVKATGVDPQAMEYSHGQLVHIGNVNLTLVPTGTP